MKTFSPPLSTNEILDLVLSLVDKSLVQVATRGSESCYSFLETIREYGCEQLREAGEEEILRDRHQEWFARLAEQAGEHSWTSEQVAWFDRVEAELDNIRAAFDWGLPPDGPIVVTPRALRSARIAGGLWHFWDIRGYFSEGRARSARACRLEGPAARIPGRARAALGASLGATLQGDFATARAFLLDALAIARDVCPPVDVVVCLAGLGVGAQEAGNLTEATEHFEAALEIGRAAGDRMAVCIALARLADVANAAGDREHAAALLEEVIPLARAQGDRWSTALILFSLGQVRLAQGDAAAAAPLLRESLVLQREAKNAWGVTVALDGLAWLAGAQGRVRRAARLLAAAQAMRGQIGVAAWHHWSADRESPAAAVRAQLGEAAFEAEWAAGQAMSPEQAIAYALDPRSPDEPAGEGPPGRRRAAVASLLTPRERDVARLVARGLTNRQIATELIITPRTAHTHVGNILSKLGFSSRAQIAVWAAREGLLDDSG